MIVEFEYEGEPLPTIGQHSVVYDGAGQPVCVIRTDHVSVGPLDEVLDPAFAWDEGEGDRTYEDWPGIAAPLIGLRASAGVLSAGLRAALRSEGTSYAR